MNNKSKLIINNLYYKIDNIYIYKNININIYRNSLILINGPNGSGKTTLLNTIYNIISPSRGSLLKIKIFYI